MSGFHICVCDSDSDEYDIPQSCVKPVAGDVSRSELLTRSDTILVNSRETKKSTQERNNQGPVMVATPAPLPRNDKVPADRLDAMRKATHEAAEYAKRASTAVKGSAPLSPSPSYTLQRHSFAIPISPCNSPRLVSNLTAAPHAHSFPVERCTSGTSQNSLASAARTALNSAPISTVAPAMASPRDVRTPASPRDSLILRQPSCSSAVVGVTRQTSNPSLAALVTRQNSNPSLIGGIPRQTSNPSLAGGAASPRSPGCSFAIPASPTRHISQYVKPNSFSSNGEARGRAAQAAPSSPRLSGAQASFPSRGSSTTMGEVCSRQVSAVAQSNSFSSASVAVASGSAAALPGSPRSSSPINGLVRRPSGGAPASFFWRSNSHNTASQAAATQPASALTTTSWAGGAPLGQAVPRQSSQLVSLPPSQGDAATTTSSPGFSPFWNPAGAQQPPRPPALAHSPSQGTTSEVVPPPGLLGDLLRAVPQQSPQPARPKSVFWKPPPEAVAVCEPTTLPPPQF